MNQGINNIPDWRVTLDGKDLTEKMRPRLISLTISEKRGDEADQLDIVLDDSDGLLAIPEEGALLSVALGWKQGRDVEIGLVDKGTFKVDEVSHSGPPDQLTIKARSADFTSEIRNRRSQSWKNSTLGAVLKEIAARNNLKPNIAQDLANIAFKSLLQSRLSDIAFLRKLGADHDAVATVKNGHLIFCRKGQGLTPNGTPLPVLTIHRSAGDRHEWTRQKRESQQGVTAYWQDSASGERKCASVGDAKGAKVLRPTYSDETSALTAAKSILEQSDRATETVTLSLALGTPSASPEQPILLPFPKIGEETTWLVAEITHLLNSASGLITKYKFETPRTNSQTSS